MQLAELEDAKLRKLAQDPQNIVYHYVDRPKPSRIAPLSEVWSNIVDLWEEVKTHTLRSEKDSRELRKVLCETLRWKQMSETHPIFFEAVVHHETTSEKIEVMRKIIQLKDRQAKGRISNGPELAQKLIFDAFSLSAEEYAQRYPDAVVREVPQK